MGGCRCSYRNCTVRSDGVTHMFHYPVFEKVRCHQWLTNAHKLEFLNLKVSQLRNRVICQHHFRDECFMNFLKDKLTFDAVPTLDGPYCDSSEYDTKASEVLKMYPISLDDIENEYLTLSDKQANFSVKYGDFLTNFDMMDVDPINNSVNDVQVISKKNSTHKVVSQPLQYNKALQNNNKNELSTQHFNNKKNKKNIQPNIEPPPFSKSVKNRIPVVNVKPVSEFPTANSLLSSGNLNGCDSSNSLIIPIVTKSNNLKNTNDSRVKILSENKLYKPVKIMGELKPLSSSLIIRVPEHKNKTKGTEEKDSENKPNSNNEIPLTRALDDSSVILQPANKEFTSCKNQTVNVSDYCTEKNSRKKIKIDIETNSILEERSKDLTSSLNQNLNVSNNKTDGFPRNKLKIAIKSNDISSNKLLTRNKINPERIAAIKEKRKFNMKLRDIIESCLDKVETHHKNDSKLQQHKNRQIDDFLSEAPELPSLQEYTISCLQARIERMENLLLSKIERNSERIVELKNSINSSDKVSKCTQTSKNEELHKRQLYKEISHYLSPNVNSLIYEELFINKFVQNTQKTSPINKKRRRKLYAKK